MIFFIELGTVTGVALIFPTNSNKSSMESKEEEVGVYHKALNPASIPKQGRDKHVES